MANDTANDLIRTSAEYEKLKTKHGTDDHVPRETQQAQGPGRVGYDKQRYDSWAREALLRQAWTLELDVDEEIERDALVDRLASRDSTMARSGS